MRQRCRLKKLRLASLFFGGFLTGQQRGMDGSLRLPPCKKRNKN